jgi:molybdopterin converting factor small subunit
VPWTDTNVVTYTLTTTAGPQVPTAITSADINLIGSDSSTDSATIAGVVQEILISESGDTITAKLADGGFGTGTELKLPDGARATTQTAGTNDDRVATTAFVQTATTGLLQLVGGFNANTGALVAPLTGNLTSGAARVALEVGDYYVVTVDGDFFGNTATPLTVGDSVIVQTAAAVGTSVETDFIIVQSDTDLASATTVGIGNSTASTSIDKLGASVTYTNPTDGTATVGVDINAQTDMPDALANDDKVLLYDASSGKNYKASIEQFSGHGSKRVSLNTSVTGISNQTSPPAGTQGWVIASNTIMGTAAMDCGIELMTDTANALGAGLTVYAEVSRASNAITVNFTAPSAIAQGEYQVIITRA